MRRTLPGLVFSAWIAVAVVFAPAAPAENLIPDGTFATGVSAWTSSGQVLTIEHQAGLGSTLAGGSGPGAMKLTHAYWGSGTYGAYVDAPISPGTVYRLEGSYLVQSADNPANAITIQVYWLDGSNRSVSSSTLLGAFVRDSWTRRSQAFVAPPATAKARIYLRVGNPEDTHETRPAVGYFDDIVFEAVTTATASQALFVPAGAAVHGQAGTYWSTNLWFGNLTSTPVWVDGAFLRQGQDNSAAVANLTRLGTVPAGGFAKIDDVATLLGVSEATGGVYLVASASGGDLPTELVKVTTHTFTPNPYGDGVYGQGIPAVPAGVLSTANVPGVFQGSDLRTNIGALNTSSGAITLKVTVLNAAGNEEVSATWALQPYEQRQVSLPSLGLSSLDGGTVVFELQGSGSFRGYTSTVDQSSGDAVYNQAR